MRQDSSLISLELRRKPISEKSMTKIFQALAHNYVLSELKVDVPVTKECAWWGSHREGFSCYPLYSMYEFFCTREEITL